MRLKDTMCEEFEKEHVHAQREHERLTALFKDVCWYNFETQCRTWRHPWPESWDGSEIMLHGVSIHIDRRNRESGSFPVYYEGTIRDAPPLPPEIILKELKEASEYLKFAREQCTAAHDWAPGGKLYEELLLRTSVPTKRTQVQEVAARISKRILNDNGGRPRRKQRNRLERTTQEAAKSAAQDLLGRVR